jgi:hypothetical protein
MKAFLMYDGEDFDVQRTLPANAPDLVQDLELNTLLEAMAAGDALIFQVAERALLLTLPDPESIIYRHQVLTDCLDNERVIRDLYQLAGDAIAAERKVFRSFSRDSPSSIVSRSVQVLEILAGFLRRLRALAEEHAASFESTAFRRFFAMLADELADEYLASVQRLLTQLKFPKGILVSAQLDAGNRGTSYTLRPTPEQGWLQRLGLLDRTGYTFTIPERDHNGFKALSELQDRGLNRVANAVGQAADHVLSFFSMLRIELGFYVGCLNLHQRLRQRDEAVCLPVPADDKQLALTATGLYDVCLALTIDGPVVGNELDGDEKSLVMITGANQGGKSTLLRALGLGQLMTQAGMFAPARALRTNVCSGLFTHFKREEDATMQSGKLDEELRRMSDIADHITPAGLLLCNESFASTNEREGSQISREVVRALTHAGVKVVFVTHQFDLADSLYAARSENSLFLRAGREESGERTYKITEGRPLPTSFGQDSYRAVFGRALAGNRDG